ncbi:MAG: SulP family inorganic anion transporter [Gammaproteobacteria bacterium]|nr:SulP family inorganic anion transporter [Gammaproteobacteria bacterium]
MRKKASSSDSLRRTWIRRAFPFLRWSSRVTKDTLGPDLLAALTGALVVLPQGVAFATIAGMPPEYGLYAGMVPAVVAALYGSSWHLVSGPTTAASVVMLSALSPLAAPGSAEYVALALTLTLMVGVIQLTMGVARLGTLVNFISHSVLVGFTAGAAILIAAKQANNFFGLDIGGDLHVYEIIVETTRHLLEAHPAVTFVALVTLLTGVIVKRLFKRFPSMLAAMIAGSLVGVALNAFFGAETTGIQMVGALPAQAPPLSMPSFSLNVLRDLGSAALAMTLFALTEAVSIARSISIRSGQVIDGNQEFIGQGLSNIVGSFFSAYVATGSFNRSGLNYDAGAQTPLAAIFAAVFLLIIVLMVAPMTAYLPVAAMAGILFLVGWRLVDFVSIRTILRASKTESTIMVVTFLSTLFLDLESAIFIGVLFSLTLYLRTTSRPRVISRVPDPTDEKRKFATSTKLPDCPQLRMVRIDDSLYFGAVPHVREIFSRIRQHYPQQKFLLLLAQGINHVDVAGAEMLAEEAEARHKMGGALYLYRLKDTKILDRTGYMQHMGGTHSFDSKGAAIREILPNLDSEVCRTCESRIFLECRLMKGGAPEAEQKDEKQ